MRNSTAMYDLAKAEAIGNGPIHVEGNLKYIGYALNKEQLTRLYREYGFDTRPVKTGKNAMERHIDVWAYLGRALICQVDGELYCFFVLDTIKDIEACRAIESSRALGETMIGVES